MRRVAGQPAVSEGIVVTKAALRAAGLLGISNKALARIVGLSEASVSRMGAGTYTLAPGEKPFELAVLFVRFYRALDAHRSRRRWGRARVAREPNAALGGTPLTLIQSVPGLVHAVAYLDARRALV